MSAASEHVKVIARRADHLAKRIAEAGNGRLTYDEKELSALLWAIDLISQLRCLCRSCYSDATAKMAGDYICAQCLKERGIDT